MSCCRRCCKHVIEPLEYEISKYTLLESSYSNAKLPLPTNTEIQLLKDKVICDILNIVVQLEKGLLPNLESLLESISAIELDNSLTNREFIIQYCLNNL